MRVHHVRLRQVGRASFEPLFLTPPVVSIIMRVTRINAIKVRAWSVDFPSRYTKFHTSINNTCNSDDENESDFLRLPLIPRAISLSGILTEVV